MRSAERGAEHGGEKDRPLHPVYGTAAKLRSGFPPVFRAGRTKAERGARLWRYLAATGAALVALVGWTRPGAAQTFTARPTGAVQVKEDTGGCAGPVIVFNEDRGRDGDPKTFARVRVDAGTGVPGTESRCVGVIPTTDPDDDTAITWTTFTLPTGLPPGLFISPLDTVIMEIDVIQADADGQPAIPINSFDLPGGLLTDDVPALGGEWRLECLVDRDADLAFTAEDLDLCADGDDEGAPGVPCGIFTFAPTTAGGAVAGGATPTTMATANLNTVLFTTPAKVGPVSDPAPANTGGGSLGATSASDSSFAETWTVTAVNVAVPGAEIWNVTGSVSGLQTGQATTGVAYTVDNTTVGFTITAAGANFIVGDDFQFTVTNGFLLDQQLWARIRTQHNPAVAAPAPYISAVLDPAPANVGDGPLPTPTASAAAVAQTWTATVVDVTVPGNELWQVVGSASGVQSGQATTGSAYTSDDGTVGFTMLAGATNFALGDDISFDVETTSTLKISDVRLQITLVQGGTFDTIVLPAFPAVAILKSRTILDSTALAPLPGELLLDAVGGTPPYVWNDGSNDPLTGPASLPNLTSGRQFTIPNGTDPDWEITGTPTSNPNGDPGVVGSHWFTVRVTDSAVPPNSNASNYNVVVDGTDITPRTLPPLTAGTFASIVFTLTDSDALGNRGINPPNYQWSLNMAAQLDGMVFSNGLMPGGTVTGPVSLTLSGTPLGQNQISFTLGVDDLFFLPATPALDNAFKDSVTYTGSSTFRILDRNIPPVSQGMRYDNTAQYPPLVTLEAVRVPTPPITTWQVTAPTVGADVPPGTGRLALLSPHIDLADTSMVSIGTASGVDFPVVDPPEQDHPQGANPLSGRYTFTVEATDSGVPTPQTASKQFTLEVLPRRTQIRAQPPPVTSETVLQFTVFAEGGVPTRDNAGTETRAIAVGSAVEPRYRLQYRVDVEQDDGTFYDDETVTSGTDAWINWTVFGETALPFNTTPVTVRIDLENDPQIIRDNAGVLLTAAEQAVTLGLRPSGGTARRYRVRFRAFDGLSRQVDGLTLIALNTPMLEAETVIMVVDPAGSDANPEPTRPTRSRQDRLN